MFTPHQSMHQFSPQRRQILGTGKRAGQQKKTFLGEEEASSVGECKREAVRTWRSPSHPLFLLIRLQGHRSSSLISRARLESKRADQMSSASRHRELSGSRTRSPLSDLKSTPSSHRCRRMLIASVQSRQKAEHEVSLPAKRQDRSPQFENPICRRLPLHFTIIWTKAHPISLQQHHSLAFLRHRLLISMNSGQHSPSSLRLATLEKQGRFDCERERCSMH